MKLIRAKFRGHCVTCRVEVLPGESCYYDGVDKQILCVTCGTRIGRVVTPGVGPIASKLQFHGTANEVIAQLRSQATKLMMDLQASAKTAEALVLALKQIEDQGRG